MKVEQNRTDELNVELSLHIVKDDYQDKRKKKLNEHRRTAEIKGFRKGMVPMGLIEKIYGQSCLVDAVNDLISESLNNYIKENGLKVIGEPLPAEDQPQVEWKDGNDFSFKFDIALAPKVDFELSAKDEIPYYRINITKEAKAEMKENLLKQYGSLEEGGAAKAEDFIIADFEQGDTKVEGTYVALRSVAEPVRPSFVGLKAGDSIDVNVNEAFVNEEDRAAMLTIMNPDDKAGLEAALRLKDQYGAEVTVVTMGLPKAEEVLREALAMGADNGILVTDRVLGGADTWATSQTIAGAIRNLDYDLIITGRQAIDGDTAQVGPQISEHLGIPVISYAQDIKIDGDSVIVQRQFDDRYHVLKAKMPCLITALGELNEPRYMTPGGIFDAFKKEITVWGRADLKDVDDSNLGLKGSPTQIAKASDKVRKGAGEKFTFDTPDEAASFITGKLQEKHII